MNREEFGVWVMVLKTYFPREACLVNKDAINLWYALLGDISYEVAELALGKWVITNKWPPTIADIRVLSAEIMYGEVDDWGESWSQVINAIHSYGSYRTEEALASMDELTRATVKRIGFTNICRSDNLVADRANYRMIYEELAKRKKQDQTIPNTLKLAIERALNNNIEEHERMPIEKDHDT